MNPKLTFVERQTFHQKPDCYDGATCDKLRPRWMTSYPKHGNEEDGEVLRIEMHARDYPPGTRVIIEVPVCPKCGDPGDFVQPKTRRRKWPRCDCGFSWAKWAVEQFS